MIQESIQTQNMIFFEPTGLRSDFLVRLNVNRGKSAQNSISFNVGLEYFSTSTVRISTTEFLLNNATPNSLIELLAAQCRKPLNELVVVLDENGKVEKISNYDEIIEIWEHEKENLKIKFSGEIFQKYISKQDEIIYEYDLLFSKIADDFFYKQFFAGIYHSAFTNNRFFAEEHCKLLGVNYLFPIQYILSDSNKEGISLIKTIDKKKYNSEHMPVDLYEVKYNLGKNNSIEQVEGTFKAQSQEVIFSISKKSKN